MPALLELIDTSPVFMAAQNAYLPFAHCPPGEVIGMGTGLTVTATELDGRDYAVRTFDFREHGENELAERLPVLVRGLGHQGLEQLVAFTYDYEAQVLVTERMAGKNVEALSLEEAESMHQAQFDALAATIDTATRAGIEIDDATGNLFYDSKEGFGLIDYTLPYRQASTGRTLKGIGQAMMWMGHDLQTFNTKQSLHLRKRAIRMVTQAGFSILPQRDSRALAEASEEWIARCFTGKIIVDAE